jgi:hypothetical protein
MDLDATWLFLSLIPSGIGFVLFVYGKKQGRLPQLVVGLLMMISPYVTSTVPMLLGVGALLVAVLWYAVKLGW